MDTWHAYDAHNAWMAEHLADEFDIFGDNFYDKSSRHLSFLRAAALSFLRAAAREFAARVNI